MLHDTAHLRLVNRQRISGDCAQLEHYGTSWNGAHTLGSGSNIDMIYIRQKLVFILRGLLEKATAQIRMTRWHYLSPLLALLATRVPA